MTARPTIRSALVIHRAKDDFIDLLRQRFPAVEFAYATTPEAIRAALDRLHPEAAFTVAGNGVAREWQRLAVDHPSVRWIHVGGSGYEQIVPWDGARVTVTNSAGVLSRFLAETVTGAILTLNGNFPAYAEQQRRKEWRLLEFRSLVGQTLVIVGLGAIGRFVAQNARALGMRVLAVNRSPIDFPEAEAVRPMSALHDTLAEADVVSIHLRLGDETRGMIDAAALDAMKPGALFINTARGAIVDEAALIERLRSGRIRSAYLDVFETEPLPPSNPIWDLPNVLLTPHASDNVAGWEIVFARLFADNLDRWQAGQALINEVRP